jgi:hypothetical protein
MVADWIVGAKAKLNGGHSYVSLPDGSVFMTDTPEECIEAREIFLCELGPSYAASAAEYSYGGDYVGV